MFLQQGNVGWFLQIEFDHKFDIFIRFWRKYHPIYKPKRNLKNTSDEFTFVAGYFLFVLSVTKANILVSLKGLIHETPHLNFIKNTFKF